LSLRPQDRTSKQHAPVARRWRERNGIRDAGTDAQKRAGVNHRILDPGAVCHFDLGALCYGIVLAAWDRGLGSVING
jgi:hypothetical protein